MSSNPFLAIDRQILADSGTSSDIDRNLYALCDDIGPRFAGTEGYRLAAEFMRDRFKEYELDHAALEPFQFTAWRRGGKPPLFKILSSSATGEIDCYALPYGAPTNPEGIEAEIIDIGPGGSDEIEANRQQIKGRFVLTTCAGNHRMQIYARCVELGAAGFILANKVPGMILPTGSVTDAEPGAIPAVGIAQENGKLIQRRIAADRRLRIRLETHGAVESATSWNVIGELTGSEHPDELVVMGGHLDSHDIGPGAFDNAAGAVMVMETARLLAKHCDHLKRTVRFIGFGAEEVGLRGSHYHAEKHGTELQNARFMLNCDTPSLGRPRGLAFHKCPKAEPYMEFLASQMETDIVCQNRSVQHSDHYPFILQGVPTAGLGGGKFTPSVQHFVHMAADTADKVSLPDLRDAACFAARFLLRAASDDDQWPDMRRSAADVDAWR